ncbi:YhcG family protein [uncultured Bacteroides sp.]|uniref:PDDEXK nuclease domain-containing protein n=1 Tax=uncultured Bacteroides sp. TaxID=162156 RepID=UPI0025F2981D|nr:PDDEXK nuclease domain-containing protein [uncultured Bacteroides sp.]
MSNIQNIDLHIIVDVAERIERLVEDARTHVGKIVNITEVITKYEIGHIIVEVVQEGKERATYGKQLLRGVSSILTDKYESGWSVDTLEKCRTLYLLYSKSATVSRKLDSTYPFTLSWSHYLILMRIESDDERNFYEIEAQKQNWSVRQLQRQYNSSLYERLALSKDKDSVLRLAQEGQTINKPDDIIKNPLTLEFLGLKPDISYSETKLENAIIDKLQQFLLELGKGFLFEARQKRVTFDEENFYVDLVFYNRLLQCYVLIDLKVDKLAHQDLGQMQMYVNYYDRYVKQDFEKPTIGILLCKEKKDALVELTLPKNSNIYAQQYALYLPDKQLLQKKLREWIEEQD